MVKEVNDMNVKTLPILSSELSEKDIVIDMSETHFPTDDDKQLRGVFVFIRNTEIQAKFDFSKCDYTKKKRYLLMYILERFDVVIPELATTWIAIVGRRYVKGLADFSILTEDEIDMLCSEENELIDNIRRISASIPLCSIEFFCKSNNIDAGEMQTSDYKVINAFNFYQMLKYPSFVNLIKIMDDYEPVYYTNYFIPGSITYQMIVSQFPYLNILNFVANTTDNEMDDVIKNMSQKLIEMINEGNG